ncbi:MAG: hypothetical protein AB8B92_07990 [Gammaproteobacteria bacterium]
MIDEQQKKTLSQVDIIILASCIVVSLLLVASHWFYLGNLHHRIGDVAWNELFQIFGNFAAFIGSIAILVKTLKGKISGITGVFSALIMGLTAAYCFSSAFSTMMSI